MLEAVPPRPLDLPAPGQPLDRGMSSLGLVMLIGALTFGVVIATALAIWGFASDGHNAFMLVAVVLGVARVVVHAIAGWQLSRGHVHAARWVEVFTLVALIHVFFLTGWLSWHDPAIGRLAGIAAATWPLAVLIATRLRAAHLTTTEPRGERAAAQVIALIAGLVLLAPLASLIAASVTAPKASGAGVGLMIVFLSVPTAIGLLAMRAGRRADPRGSLAALAWAGQVIAVLVGIGTFFLLIAGAHFALAYVPFLVGTCALAPVALRAHAGREGQPVDPALGHGSARMTIAWILLAQALVTLAHPLMAADPRTDLARVVLFAAGGWTFGEPWMRGLVGAIELWAALELLAGTRRARAAALVYALAVIAVLVRGWLATYHGAAELIRDPRWFDEYAVRVGLKTLHTWVLLTVPAVTLLVVQRPYVPLTRVRRGGA
jgi:hypothetical protein